MEAWKCHHVLLLLFLPAILQADDTSFPIHCPRDNKIQSCIASAIQTIIRRFRTGLPEVGFPVVDPLKFPKLEIRKKAGSVLDLDLTLSDFLVKDITINATVSSVKFHPEKFELIIETMRPKAYFRGNYKAKGKLLWLPIWGAGTFAFEMRHITDKFHFSGKGITKEDGKKYWEITDFKVTFQPKSMTLRFNNLYDGNSLLSVGAHALINGQWNLFYQYIKDYSDKAYSDTLKPHWRNLFLKRPFEEIFPIPKSS